MSFYIFIISFTLNQHVLPKLCYILAWFIIWRKCFLIYIDGSSFLMHKSYILQQKYKWNEWMLLTQEPTFVIPMVVTQEPTIRKIVATHAFQILEWFVVTYHHHVNPNSKSKSFKKESVHSCMRTCNQSSWGECCAEKRPHFIHLSHTIYHLIPILFFHKTINIHHFHNKYGVILPFSKSFIF